MVDVIVEEGIDDINDVVDNMVEVTAVSVEVSVKFN